jgi:glycosyltransferase involved in cell wall biosynthesis
MTESSDMAGATGAFDVLHVVPALFDGEVGVVGGAERYALELARHMADVVPTALLTFGPREERRTVGRLQIILLETRRYLGGIRQNPLRAAAVPAALRARVVHCHQRFVLMHSLIAAAGKLAGRRVFVTDHGGGGWDLGAYFDTERLYRGFLHVSAFSRAASGQADLPRAHVIYGGVDGETFRPPPPDAPRRRVAVYVGRILPHKGLDDLILASAADAPVEVIGRATDVDYLRHLERLARGRAASLAIDPTEAQIREAYRGAGCVVLPSVHRSSTYARGGTSRVPELLGQALLEAMACGAPVIATRVGGLPEVVRHGENGVLVAPNRPDELRAALRAVLGDPPAARRMGATGRAHVETQFNWPAVARRCLRLYEA